METFSFKPNAEDEERYRIRVNDTKVWWVQFNEIVERIFCSRQQTALVLQADDGIAWAGISTSGRPRVMPTDQPDVDCIVFDAPHYLMAVEESCMRGWMEVVRANGLHGKYRLSGTRTEYEF